MPATPKTRMFEGKRFKLDSLRKNKYEARHRAAVLRNRGYYARVVQKDPSRKSFAAYLVYKRRK